MAFNAITRAVQYRNPQRVAGLSCSPLSLLEISLGKDDFFVKKISRLVTSVTKCSKRFLGLRSSHDDPL